MEGVTAGREQGTTAGGGKDRTGGAEGDPRHDGAGPRGEVNRRFRRIREWRDRMRSNPRTRRPYRIIVGVVGGAITVGGLVLVPFPGPGWAIVIVGLAILASEFTWAERLRDFVVSRVRAWTRWLGRQPIWVRVVVGLLTFVFVLGVMWATFALLGVPSWIPDSWVEPVPGLTP